MPGVVWDSATDLVPTSQGSSQDWYALDCATSFSAGAVSPWASLTSFSVTPVLRLLVPQDDANWIGLTWTDIARNVLLCLQGGCVYRATSAGSAAAAVAWTHGTAVPAPPAPYGSAWLAWSISAAAIQQMASSPDGSGFGPMPTALQAYLLTPSSGGVASRITVADSFFLSCITRGVLMSYLVGGLV